MENFNCTERVEKSFIGKKERKLLKFYLNCAGGVKLKGRVGSGSI